MLLQLQVSAASMCSLVPTTSNINNNINKLIIHFPDSSVGNMFRSSLLSFRAESSSNNNTPFSSCSASSIDSPLVSDMTKELAVHGVSEKIVGVLGGGQLGRMLCQAASEMAIKVSILDPSENCPASSLSYYHMVGEFNDSATVEKFAKRCGVLTVEIEHVDVATLEKLEQQGVECQPKASTIRMIQDKYLQKSHFLKHGIPLPKFVEIDNLEDARRAGVDFGYPLMIKSKRLAYDGRGNVVAESEEDISSAVYALGGYERGLYVRNGLRL